MTDNVGLTVGPFLPSIVHETFPIGEPLPMNPNEEPVVKEEFTKYGDQRDWWERVGRWK